jgi:hypothetical protein
VAVHLGHTDTDNTTCLHIPDIAMVVAGDAVYNDVHLYLPESDPDRRKAWIAAIDTIQALDPRVVISGHKRAGRTDDPHTLEETRQYIRDFDSIDAATTTARDVYDNMLEIYPERASTPVCCGSLRVPSNDDRVHDDHRLQRRHQPPSGVRDSISGHGAGPGMGSPSPSRASTHGL